MQKSFFLLVFVLVLLGFLASTSINMYNDMEQLKEDNQKLSSDLTQLRANYETISQERDRLKSNNTDLNNKFEALQTAYNAENQARLKAEADTEIYKGMMVNMMNNVPATSTLTCKSAEGQATSPENIFLSGIVPVGAGYLVLFAAVILFVAGKYHTRKNRKPENHLVYPYGFR